MPPSAAPVASSRAAIAAAFVWTSASIAAILAAFVSDEAPPDAPDSLTALMSDSTCEYVGLALPYSDLEVRDTAAV